MILTDGMEIFGEGPDESAAIADAIATCQPQGNDFPLAPVTREWVAREMTAGHLWIDESDHGE